MEKTPPMKKYRLKFLRVVERHFDAVDMVAAEMRARNALKALNEVDARLLSVEEVKPEFVGDFETPPVPPSLTPVPGRAGAA
jgi:hypothetical protein